MSSLSLHDRIEEIKRKHPKGIRVVTWSPHPRQAIFLDCAAEIILFGGAKAGGKSEALLAACARGHNKSGYKAILFRRTYKELELHVIPRSRELFGKSGKYDSQKHFWTFQTPDGGQSFLYFGFLQYENDVFDYQGSQFARIAFDESTLFSESMVRYMISCLRSPLPDVKRQIFLAANPIGPGFGWHKKMFIENRRPDTIYLNATWPSDGKAVGMSTAFFPSKVWDNLTLMKNDPHYPDKLKTQYGPITEALLNGSWEQTLYMAFKFEEKANTCPAKVLPKWAMRIIAIDYGKTDAASAVWLCFDNKRVWAYRDYTIKGRDLKPFCKDVVDRSTFIDEHGAEVREEIVAVVMSHELFADQGAGTTRADQAREIFDKAGWMILPSGRDPEGRIQLLREYLRTEPLPGNARADTELDFDYWQERLRKEGARAMEDFYRITGKSGEPELLPRLMMFCPTEDGRYGCPDLIRNLPMLVTKMGLPYELEDGQEDDSFDALTYGLRYYMTPVDRPLEEIYLEKMAGRMPDSTMGLHMAVEAIKEEMEDDKNQFKPVEWKTEVYTEKR